MDFSPENIKMCREAYTYLKDSVPLLSKRRRMYYEVDGKVGMWWDIINTSNSESAIPLWEQDQLQEMIGEEYTINLLYDFHSFYNTMGSDVYPHTIGDNISMEQLWLAYVMFRKYNRKWDDDSWIPA